MATSEGFDGSLRNERRCPVCAAKERSYPGRQVEGHESFFYLMRHWERVHPNELPYSTNLGNRPEKHHIVTSLEDEESLESFTMKLDQWETQELVYYEVRQKVSIPSQAYLDLE